ncbi:MAG: hypothetical protein WCR76_11190 [Sphaerochaetaceae bacterium]
MTDLNALENMIGMPKAFSPSSARMQLKNRSRAPHPTLTRSNVLDRLFGDVFGRRPMTSSSPSQHLPALLSQLCPDVR